MNNPSAFIQHKLEQALQQAAPASSFLLALSGGMDSVVLLHALCRVRAGATAGVKLRALHINHQLHAEAASWQRHCAELCTALAVEFSSMSVAISASTGIENAARDARYKVFETALAEHEVLLLGHHLDDQMETLLLRQLRGSGSRGLSGIPQRRTLGNGFLLRPLLDIPREQLQHYAKANALQWIEDPSNQDQSFDRNYCRHSVLPKIAARWPGYRESWSKAATLANESEQLNLELAAIDLLATGTDSPSCLALDKVLRLSEPRRRNLLRYWLAGLGARELGWNQLQQLSQQVLQADGNTRFLAKDIQLHCYRHGLYALSADALAQAVTTESAKQSWDPISDAEISLPNNGSLQCHERESQGVSLAKLDALNIRYRAGGESCRLAGRPNKSLKKILQEEALRPWLRERMPLLYQGDSLICIPGVGCADEFAAKTGERGYVFEWLAPDLSFAGRHSS